MLKIIMTFLLNRAICYNTAMGNNYCMVTYHRYIFLSFILLLISIDSKCSEASNLASLMSTCIKTRKNENINSSTNIQTLYSNIVPNMLTQCKGLRVSKNKLNKV